jgi:hypothetical protein
VTRPHYLVTSSYEHRSANSDRVNMIMSECRRISVALKPLNWSITEDARDIARSSHCVL